LPTGWPVFATKAWACSLREIDWTAEGFTGKKLSQIAAGYGFFFDAHRAVDDCHAGVDILTRMLPRTGQSGFAALLKSARTP
jgi:DNA polymerase-3 subunit epsilon